MEGTGTYIKASLLLLILVFAAGMGSGGIISYLVTYQQINTLENKVSNLKARIYGLYSFQNASYYNVTIFQNGTSFSEIYEKVKDSIVLIRVLLPNGEISGSGFVYNYTEGNYSLPVVITNYHVIHEVVKGNAISLSVTFSNGHGYPAEVNGTDPYADLAVLTVNAPEYEFKPLEIVSSSTLKVGDLVIAIGNPIKYTNSMTIGVVSALGRTISEPEFIGRFRIANVIQTSAQLNPGNSGGPLLNYLGQVVGVTTAIAVYSEETGEEIPAQGIGFAIPSDTILKEIKFLIENGTYLDHSWMGIEGIDMSYEIAQAMGVNVTYGFLITGIDPEGPAAKTDLRGGKEWVQIGPYSVFIGGDIIIEINGTKIKNGDDLATYLERYTYPYDTVILKVIRKENDTIKTLEIPLTLERRPPPEI